jgi:hypothetical protein
LGGFIENKEVNVVNTDWFVDFSSDGLRKIFNDDII